MSKLEELRPNAAVRGILPDGLVAVVRVHWFGSEALELTYKTPTGKVANELLYRRDEPRLEVVEQGRSWSFDGDGALFRLVAEAHRIRLAPLFDPLLVVRVLVKMLEPYKGDDPCCCPGGMSVQSERFIEAHAGRLGDISIYGQQSNYTAWRLA